MGSRRLARALWAVAALTIACSSCGGSSSSEPARISVTAAFRNPCLLVTQAEANAILGKAGKPTFESGFKTESGFNTNSCAIRDPGNATTIDITVQNVSFDPTTAAVLIRNAAPVPAVGHQAVCGLSLPNGNPFAANAYELYGAINSHYSLEVNGASSCAVDSQFATKAYSRL